MTLTMLKKLSISGKKSSKHTRIKVEELRWLVKFSIQESLLKFALHEKTYKFEA